MADIAGTDILQAYARGDGYAEHAARQARFEARAAAARAVNRAAVFAALAALGVATAAVEYNGSGDEGTTQDACATDREGRPVDIHGTTMAYAVPGAADGDGASETTMTVGDAVEALASDILADEHADWEDGEGGCGTFTFDVAAQTVTNVHGVHHVETDYTTHTF